MPLRGWCGPAWRWRARSPAAALVIVGFCVGAYFGARQLFVDVLPGVSPATAGEVTGVIAALGVCIGAMAALFAFRRVRT